MSDRDDRGNAWRVPPSAYLARRPAHSRVPARPPSRSLPMSDGCRLAVDIDLPAAMPSGPTPPARLPTICVFTPYYRRFALAPGARGTEPSPNIFRYRDMFVPRGYALAVVDVRGTGASFGTRDSFRSPKEGEGFLSVAEWIGGEPGGSFGPRRSLRSRKEREDFRVVADCIVGEPWSDGRIGATGISYLGAAANFLASTGHPAVK